MLNGKTESLIVGFLCSCSEAKSFADGTWVEITGEISRGNYHGEVPLVKIEKIKQIDKPSNEFTYQPDSTYIPTGILY